jgi:hypothetical protein
MMRKAGPGTSWSERCGPQLDGKVSREIRGQMRDMMVAEGARRMAEAV